MDKLKKIILGLLITASFASCVVAVPRGGYYGGGYGYGGGWGRGYHHGYGHHYGHGHGHWR